MVDDAPGFAIRSWGDLTAAISLGLLLIGGLIWLLKLESRIEILKDQVHTLRELIAGRLRGPDEDDRCV